MAKNVETVFSIILAIVLFESTAQYHIKKSRETENLLYLLVGMFSYSIVCCLLHKCYSYDGVGVTNLTWSVLSIVSMMMIGHVMFNEEVNMFDFIGVIMCFAGLYCIFIYGHNK